MQLSSDQSKSLKNILTWIESSNKVRNYLTLGGYAGTGKTTLISILRSKLYSKNKNLSIAFCSYTGKATRVLTDKLRSAKSIYSQDHIGTIHSLIYSPVVNDDEEIVGWERKNDLKADLIIIDEASMVDESIWSDIQSYGIPIIAIGDHGQLPPIRGNFNLMENPMIKLNEIHRQAKDNPIIQISVQARKDGNIPYGKFSPTVMKLAKSDSDTREKIQDVIDSYDTDSMVLCGYNTTRVKLNNYIRKSMEFFDPDPQVGDRVICLRNNHSKSIFNGMLGIIHSITRDSPEWYYSEILMDGEDNIYKGLIYADQFNTSAGNNFTKDRKKAMKGDLFDFGYALTVHKSQGSQARKVILFEERFKQMDDEMWRRWLYTAVTRAEEELYIVG